MMNVAHMHLHYMKEWTYGNISEKVLENKFESILRELKKIIVFNELTEDELMEIGFKRWSEDSDLLLIPNWYYDFLEKGMVIYGIDGETAQVGDDIDRDTRFGVLAYGINFPRQKENENA
jgi:hypothetical protein